MSFKRVSFILTAVLIFGLLAGCTADTGFQDNPSPTNTAQVQTPEPTSVPPEPEISADFLLLMKSTKAKLAVTNSDNAFQWHSSNDSVVSVDDSGRVAALSEGAATITAASGNITLSCTIVVAAQEKPEASIIPDLSDQYGPPYVIKVNRAANCVTIYASEDGVNCDIPIKAMICSTGEATPLGTFRLGYKAKWNRLVGYVWGMYASHVTGDILFHSVPYDDASPDTLPAEEYNKLGTTASHGCIRLTVADVKWIFDNVPSWTQIIIYDDTSDPGPLGKPQLIPMPETSTWDPTDPNPDNPWILGTPEIRYYGPKTLSIGESIDLRSCVSASDSCGANISEDIFIAGYVDISSPGDYAVTYSVTDAAGKMAELTVTISVIGA